MKPIEICAIKCDMLGIPHCSTYQKEFEACAACSSIGMQRASERAIKARMQELIDRADARTRID